MLAKIIIKTRSWLFSDYEEELKLKQKMLEFKENNLEMEKKRIANLTVVDAVREQLKGFDPKQLDLGDTSILDEITNEDGQTAFLQQVAELEKNQALKPILNYLTRNIVLYAAKEATSIKELNFNRATINGFSLLEETIGTLFGIYKQRTTPPEDFDHHEVV